MFGRLFLSFTVLIPLFYQKREPGGLVKERSDKYVLDRTREVTGIDNSSGVLTLLHVRQINQIGRPSLGVRAE